ncbi:MAG: hypothetical protein IT243_02350 [Bacteroidia bacterium]|nr:hypothetical protein [Bacteroidia bacterium]
MKQLVKYSILLFVAVYILQTAGINISVHYCGNNISSVSFFEKAKKCKCLSKKMKPNCCKDKSAKIKISSFQQKSNHLTQPIKFVHINALFISINESTSFNFTKLSITSNNKNKPPDDISHPIYIRNRVFTI